MIGWHERQIRAIRASKKLSTDEKRLDGLDGKGLYTKRLITHLRSGRKPAEPYSVVPKERANVRDTLQTISL